MRIKELKLTNYRKFKNINLSFTSGTNLIVGSNASGKTTIIEAIGFAIYGELLMGSSLLEALRFGSDSCRIELSLSNSDEMKVTRNIQKVGDSANQKIILNGKEVKTSNINKTKKVFVDKDLFFEIVSVDQFGFHNLLDMSQRRFQEIFSGSISPWDINRILDNSKSLLGYLRSREDLYKEKVTDYERTLSQHQSTIENLDAFLEEKKELTERLEDIEKERAKLVEELGRKDNEIREIKVFNKTISEVLESQRKFSKELGRCAELLNQEDMPSSLDPRITSRVRDYISKIDFLHDYSRELSSIINNILEFQKEQEYDIESSHRDYSNKLTERITEIGKIQVQLRKISDLIHRNEQQQKLVERTSKSLNECRAEMERYQELLTIQEHLEKLARRFWVKHFGYFLSKVANRVNRYLRNLDVEMKVDIKDEKMHVLMDNNVLDFNVLSGGERTLLNLLSRIALIKEMGTNDLLVLDDAVTFLDQKTTSKVFSFLVSLKKDFEQIIVTTHRKDIAVNFDSMIDLDG